MSSLFLFDVYEFSYQGLFTFYVVMLRPLVVISKACRSNCRRIEANKADLNQFSSLSPSPSHSLSLSVNCQIKLAKIQSLLDDLCNDLKPVLGFPHTVLQFEHDQDLSVYDRERVCVDFLPHHPFFLHYREWSV